MKKNKFNPGVRISIFFVFFAIVFFSLGLWQIERGQSKTDLLKEFKSVKRIKESSMEDFMGLFGDKKGKRIFNLIDK